MESVIVKRGIAIFSIIVVVIVASVACNAIAGGEEDPELSNPDDTYMSFDGIDITNEQLYNRIRSRDGIQHLANYIDQQLLSDYIDAVSEEEIEAEINRITYGTNDPEELDRLTEGEKEEMEIDFQDRILLEGWNPEDSDSVDEYMRMYIAQMNYTRDLYRTEDESDPNYISDDDLKSFYNDFLQGDATVVPLRFYNEAEMRNVFNHFNLVENFEGGFGEYVGEEDIEDVEDFDSDNTNALDDDEVLEFFIDIHNYMNQHTDNVDTSLSGSDLVDEDVDAFSFNQYDLQMLGERRGDELYDNLSQSIWHDLRESERPYTAEGETVQNELLFFYGVDFEDVEAFEDMDESLMREEYVDTLIGEEAMQEAMFDLHAEHNLVIHDSKLAAKYEMQVGRDLYEAGDGEAVASTDDITVNADELFEYAQGRVGALYGTDVAKVEYLFNSEFFDNVYGSNQSVLNNNSERMSQHRNHLRTEKNWFANGVFEQMGLSPEEFEWAEYLFIFGETVEFRPQILQMMGVPQDPLGVYNFQPDDSFHSERDMLRQMVERTIRYDMMYDNVDYNDYLDRVEHNHDNYFSLDTEHLLIYVDFDNDFVPDNFADYYDSLSDSEQEELEALHEELHETFTEMLDDEDADFDELVSEYMTSLRGEDEDDEDYSKWAKFRNRGLRVMYEDLSAPQEEGGERRPLNYQNTQNYDDAFVESLQDIYRAYDDEADHNTNDDMTQSQFGLHFIHGRLPEDHMQPSAYLDEDSDEYDEQFENDSSVPNIEQMNAYTENILAQFRGEQPEHDVPQSVEQALEVYFQPEFNAIYSDGNYSVIMSDIMIEGDVSFTMDHDHQLGRLESLSEFYTRRLFPSLD